MSGALYEENNWTEICTEASPEEDTERRWPTISQGKRPPKKPTC